LAGNAGITTGRTAGGTDRGLTGLTGYARGTTRGTGR
jgi:hypothetical protein